MLKHKQSFVDFHREVDQGIVETDKRCTQHGDRDAEYFCRDWLTPVWVRCMYYEHQAHSLCQMEDVLMVVYKEFELLYKKIKTANLTTKNYGKIKQQLFDKYTQF